MVAWLDGKIKVLDEFYLFRNDYLRWFSNNYLFLSQALLIPASHFRERGRERENQTNRLWIFEHFCIQVCWTVPSICVCCFRLQIVNRNFITKGRRQGSLPANVCGPLTNWRFRPLDFKVWTALLMIFNYLNYFFSLLLLQMDGVNSATTGSTMI